MVNRSDRLVQILDDFVDASRDVEAAAVVSLDGLAMASAVPDHMEEDRLGAMVAALLSLGEQAAVGLGRGALSQVFVEGAGGYVFLMSAREQAVLTAVTGHEAKIGLMLYQMRRAADEVGRVLELAGFRVGDPPLGEPGADGAEPGRGAGVPGWSGSEPGLGGAGGSSDRGALTGHGEVTPMNP